MKKIFFVLIFLSFTINTGNSQWIQQTSPVNHQLLNIKFANDRIGWISTLSGTVMKTTNGGINWTVQYSIPGKFLFGLCCVDSMVVYSVGWFETILKTTNGGINWTEIRNGTAGEGHSYEAVYFINKDTGWICGSGNLVFKTTNGGITFDSTFISGRFYDIYFRNYNDGLVCGQSAGMYKTTNGGSNWIETIVPVGIKAADFYRLTFVNQNTGYTQGVQNSKVYKTTNFGLTWDSLARIIGVSESYCIFFSNAKTGWSCGAGYKLFKTIDSGYTWNQQTLPGSQLPLNTLWFNNENTGWVIGNIGRILNTTNGGVTFINEATTKIDEFFNLSQNYPNPFNGQTEVDFEIKEYSEYKLEIFNLNGKKIDEVFKKFLNQGNYTIKYKTEDLSSGIYIYKLSSDKFSLSKKLILLK